jgi:excinuclease ABC subunit C
MNARLKEQIDLLPQSPGVYLMYNINGKVIYVGKAKILKNRVSQYFLRPQKGKVKRMVNEVDHFETIQTETEKEALLLEINLIRQYYPPFNILLKDGKSYPYIALYKKNDPYLRIMYKDNDPNYHYYGPYPNSGACYEIMNLLNDLFPLRKCKTIPPTPCLYYHMHQCLAPCLHPISKEEYEPLIQEIDDFLNGNDHKKRREIEHLMKEEAKLLHFEKAAEYKKTLDAIDHVISKQSVHSQDKTNRDVFALSTRDGYLGLAVLLYRKGKLLGKDFFVVELFDDMLEQASSLIAQYYVNHPLPKEVMVSIPEIASLLSLALDVRVYTPSRGSKMELIDLALKNAKAGLDSHFLTARLEDDKVALLEEIGKLANIPTPYRIELFDNSHIQGASPIGAMVCFINGEKAKKMYRKFNIEHEEKRDDFASMREVVYRRYSRLKEENQPFPDLIIVDGGLGQIHAAKEALDQAEVTIPLLGLYKNDKHQTEGLMDINGEIYPMDPASPLFFLLMRMQDEVHRYAIKFHHEQRAKGLFVSLLDGIPGLGEKRKRTLYARYPSIEEMKNASVSELEQILPTDVASSVYQALHEK